MLERYVTRGFLLRGLNYVSRFPYLLRVLKLQTRPQNSHFSSKGSSGSRSKALYSSDEDWKDDVILHSWEIDQQWDLPEPILPHQIFSLDEIKQNKLKKANTKILPPLDATDPDLVQLGRVSIPTRMVYTAQAVELECQRFPRIDLNENPLLIGATIDRFYTTAKQLDDQRKQTDRMIVARSDENGRFAFVETHRKGCPKRIDTTGDELVVHRKNTPIHNFELLKEAYAINVDELENHLDLKDKEKNAEEQKENNRNEAEKETEKIQSLTPAQRFFLENRDQLLARAQEYHSHKTEHFEELQDELHQEQNIKSGSPRFDTFYRDPVIRLPKNHLWDFGASKEEEMDYDEVELEQGRMPSIEDLLRILRQERVADIKVIDLEKCGRRDLGLFLILGTGKTGLHCRRVGKIISQLIRRLEIPYISESSYCWGSASDHYIISHCGALQLHLLTNEMRSKYSIDKMLLAPHEHFRPDIFPGYFDCLPSSPPPYVLKYIENLQQKNEKLQDAFIIR